MIAVVGGKIVGPGRVGPPVAGTVLIAGEKIVAIGPRVRVARGAKIVRAHGKFIVPGLKRASRHLKRYGQRHRLRVQ